MGRASIEKEKKTEIRYEGREKEGDDKEEDVCTAEVDHRVNLYKNEDV
jgi:hypothetical protein